MRDLRVTRKFFFDSKSLVCSNIYPINDAEAIYIQADFLLYYWLRHEFMISPLCSITPLYAIT